MARQTVIADSADTVAADPNKVVPIPVGKPTVYVVCSFDTPDGGVRQTAIPMPRFLVDSGKNKGRARWATKGGQYGTVVDSRKDLPVSGYLASLVSSTWVRHSRDFAFVPEAPAVRDDGTPLSPGVTAPVGDDLVTVQVLTPGTDNAPDTLETLRLVNWVRQALNGRQTGIRSRLALVGLAGSAAPDKASEPATKSVRTIGGIEVPSEK